MGQGCNGVLKIILRGISLGKMDISFLGLLTIIGKKNSDVPEKEFAKDMSISLC